jgi:hypothetical protein
VLLGGSRPRRDRPLASLHPKSPFRVTPERGWFNGDVPWCEHCSRYLSPSTVLAEGVCPQCGRAVDPGRAHAPVGDAVSAVDGTAAATPDAARPDDAPLPIPWHLKLLAGALAVYLGYRFMQMGEWLVHALR